MAKTIIYFLLAELDLIAAICAFYDGRTDHFIRATVCCVLLNFAAIAFGIAESKMRGKR